MAWVRYDDNFYSNPKVTAVVAEDPGALALHVLANTWTNKQKTPGFVPIHQPSVLLCDRPLGAKWAGVLVRSGLWHERATPCEECAAEYAELPASAEGFLFHNAKEYRAPARDRTTPGTPADLSEKRRAAGRRGGQVSAAKRKARASGDEGEANSVSKSSKLVPAGVTPEPEPVPATEHPSDVLFDTPPAASPAKKTTTTRADRNGTRIPDDFNLTEGMRNWARDKMSHVDPERETEKFINYWQGRSGKEANKKDWNAAWRYWMLNAADRYPSNPIQRGSYPDRNGVAVRDAQPRQSAGERKFLRGQALGAELDAEFAASGGRQ
ncbi:hypothetical protein ABZY58_11950 [Micromonospora tulbaghiae]|uniref:hypothetical protein n=1 Tax=Micromonospora tulbaghiae TaxID=479978 RepID=UPI0033A183C4